MESLKKTARVAGILYLVACIPAPFSLLYVPSTLIVRGNAAETATQDPGVAVDASRRDRGRARQRGRVSLRDSRSVPVCSRE